MPYNLKIKSEKEKKSQRDELAQMPADSYTWRLGVFFFLSFLFKKKDDKENFTKLVRDREKE